jgi:hypothetical protein
MVLTSWVDLILVTDDVSHHLDPAAIARLRRRGAPVVIPASGSHLIPDRIVMANGDVRALAGVQVRAVPAYDLTAGTPAHPKGQGKWISRNYQWVDPVLRGRDGMRTRIDATRPNRRCLHSTQYPSEQGTVRRCLMRETNTAKACLSISLRSGSRFGINPLQASQQRDGPYRSPSRRACNASKNTCPEVEYSFGAVLGIQRYLRRIITDCVTTPAALSSGLTALSVIDGDSQEHSLRSYAT